MSMSKHILIVEDNQTLAQGLAKLLRRRSYEVSLRANGIEALQSIAVTPPDLLLLDLRLPGLHGIELLKKLRRSSRTARLPVIILSGVYKGEKYHQAARSLGVEHYLEKPFKAAEVLTVIDRLLGADSTPVKSFSHHLRQAFRQRFSGQLVLGWPDVRRTLVFIKGAPVTLRPGFAYRDFGDYLRCQNLLNDTEYEYYATVGNYRHECLVELGCLAHTDLLQAKLEYLRQELEHGFGAKPAQADWLECTVPDLLQVIAPNVPELFYRGYRRFPGPAAGQLSDRFAGHYPTLIDGFYRHINFLNLTADDKTFLRKMDGRTTLAACLGSGDIPAPLLLTLLNLDMLRFSSTPEQPASAESLPIRTLFNRIDEDDDRSSDTPLENFDDLVGEKTAADPSPAEFDKDPEPVPSQEAAGGDLAQTARIMVKSLENKNHYEIFGIKPAKFSVGLLKERYFAITRQFGPEVLMQLGAAEAAVVEELLSAVATAYDTLSDVVKKERYDELLDAGKIGLGREGDDLFQAQVQAESGKVFIAMAEWDNAEKALQEAVTFNPNGGEVLAHLAWAISRNPRHAGSQAMQNKARQMLNKALAMERTPEGFAYKGWLLLETGQDLMAESEFNKALKLDARHAMARMGLRTIRDKQEQQKKSLFKRMFT